MQPENLPEVILFTLSTEEEKQSLPAYDNTTLVGFNTCPMYGRLHYADMLQMPRSRKSTALEAGAACHRTFAAIRLYDAINSGWITRERFDNELRRILGEDCFDSMSKQLNHEDSIKRYRNFALESFYTSGYVGDPDDKRRTTDKIEEALLYYIDRFELGKRKPYGIYNPDPQAQLGIEMQFDATVRLDGVPAFRFVGMIDGLHYTRDESALVVVDNKTTSRITDAFEQSQELATQFTGYCIAAESLTGLPCNDVRVMALTLPLPKTAYDFGGYLDQGYVRPAYAKTRWLRWALEMHRQIAEWKQADFESVPMYTHSCSRYFKPCQFIPFCSSSPEDRSAMLPEMDTWNWITSKKEEA
jgi:PD-(D/E)XK nuclease superfamily